MLPPLLPRLAHVDFTSRRFHDTHEVARINPAANPGDQSSTQFDIDMVIDTYRYTYIVYMGTRTHAG